MLLGEELERNITDAWLKLRDKILSDPDQLRRRLARRRSRSLMRPPRAWCIALRASDRRINPMHWIITPEHAMDLNDPGHPYEPIEHTVTIQKHGIRRCCNPVSFSIERAVNVARMFGVSDATMRQVRRRGRFFEDYKRGPRGRRIPFLSPNGEVFDPNHCDFAAPDPIWGSRWEFLSHAFPDDFEQTVIRRPIFRRMSKKGMLGHPEYQYRENYRLVGYLWLCPGCKKPCRTIYYPLAVRTIFGWPGFSEYDRFDDPARKAGVKLTEADLPQIPPGTFACCRCHNVNWDSTIHPGFWNEVVGYLTAGLLYGKEVERPAGFVGRRKRTRIRQLNRSAPKMREVLERFAKGWSDAEIAREMRISRKAVELHFVKACKQEMVKGRRGLAKKLGVWGLMWPNRDERAERRRERVLELVLCGLTNEEIGRRLGVAESYVNRDVGTLYKRHGIGGPNEKRRGLLAEKLGVRLPKTALELRREKVAEMRGRGMTYREIAEEMGMSMSRVNHDLERGRRRAAPPRTVVSETAAAP